MDTSTNPNQPLPPGGGSFTDDGEIRPPVIEWIKNTPATTTHLPCPNSSWLESLSYDSSSLRLTVTTKEGNSWQHGMVYPNQFEEMQLHPSKGSFYTQNIKGKHPTTTIQKKPKPGDYPRRKNHEPENRFKNPLYERYQSKGRYE